MFFTLPKLKVRQAVVCLSPEIDAMWVIRKYVTHMAGKGYDMLNRVTANQGLARHLAIIRGLFIPQRGYR